MNPAGFRHPHRVVQPSFLTAQSSTFGPVARHWQHSTPAHVPQFQPSFVPPFQRQLLPYNLGGSVAPSGDLAPSNTSALPPTTTTVQTLPHPQTNSQAPRSRADLNGGASQATTSQLCPFLTDQTWLEAAADTRLGRSAVDEPPNYPTLVFRSVSSGVTNRYLKQLFETCGPVKSLVRFNKPASPPHSKVPLGYGFVEYEDPDSFIRCLNIMNGLELPPLSPGAKARRLQVAPLNAKTKRLIEAYDAQRQKTSADILASSNAQSKIDVELKAMSAVSSLLNPGRTQASAPLQLEATVTPSEVQSHTVVEQPLPKRQKISTISSSDRSFDSENGSSSLGVCASDKAVDASPKTQSVINPSYVARGTQAGSSKPLMSNENDPPAAFPEEMRAKRKRDDEDTFEARTRTTPLANIDANVTKVEDLTI
ncbi:hypothetical protein SISNIDRAFT_485296 [Sistotremastrum niveocremeum HHB9708]|uniref:RRM domain-containing protein n=1 Tax=Sistotremastrum niveocremeum HHB9708 TaxID=1314777 RepID=A0A164UZT6_9AGAM|nr:hypothetical protein SISNIDRAFT_485296 [Sistotremastrum niveocremeum HHB9708]